MTRTSENDPRDERLSDAAYERLRAEDPAAQAEPDLDAIRATVQAAVAAEATAGTSTGTSTGTTTDEAATATAQPGATPGAVVDLGERRAARRPARWLQIAAVSAGVLAVGGGAFALGSSSAQQPVTALGTIEPATGSASSPAAPEPAIGSSREFASGLSMPAAGSTADMKIAPWSSGRTVFTASGLSDAGTNASAWAFDSAAAFSAETAATIAAALGVSGDPSLVYGAWHVGSTDWTQPSLDLQSDSQTSVYYNNPTVDPWSEGATARAAGAEAATTALTDVLTSLGVDPATYVVEVPEIADEYSTLVYAHQTVDGVRTGLSWQAGVTTEGILNLSGQLAPLVDLGSYEVVSPVTAVERLSDPRFGASPSYEIFSSVGVADDATARIAVEPDTMEAPSDDPAAVPTLPPVATPGSTFAWPVTAVTITGATLGTASYVQPDGSAALLPTYTLTGSDGSTWTVVAVADSHLDFAPAG